jgi:hypothetical protein
MYLFVLDLNEDSQEFNVQTTAYDHLFLIRRFLVAVIGTADEDRVYSKKKETNEQSVPTQQQMKFNQVNRHVF